MTNLLTEAQKEIQRVDAEVLLSHLLGVSRPELYIYDKAVDETAKKRFYSLVKKRKTGRPIQYIIGKTEFMGLDFIVTPDVLIPRPETELLVEEIASLARGLARGIHNRPVNILDLGTGSGNIAIALTKFVSGCKIIASDISKKALNIARKNAKLHDKGSEIKFVLSDLFDNIGNKKFDIITSNPPYVASGELPTLDREIGFEPVTALDGGRQGLDFYRRIIGECGPFLNKNGFIVLEAGYGQAEAIKKMLKKSRFVNIKSLLDYNSINRVIIGQWIG